MKEVEFFNQRRNEEDFEEINLEGKYLNITAKQQPQEVVEEEEQNDKELYFIGRPFH